jgi:hypothetical protein
VHRQFDDSQLEKSSGITHERLAMQIAPSLTPSHVALPPPEPRSLQAASTNRTKMDRFMARLAKVKNRTIRRRAASGPSLNASRIHA